MTDILIKPQYHNTVIAFNNSGVVLSKRSQQDLIDLGIMAHQSGNPILHSLFIDLPSLQKLQQMKLGKIEEQVMGTSQVNEQTTENKNNVITGDAGTKRKYKKRDRKK